MRWFAVFVLVLLSFVQSVSAATLRIGLNEDPDALDPAQGGTFVGRVVFAAVCDKLIDTDAKSEFIPQLATSWEWSPDARALTLHLRSNVRFHDGELMDAASVQASIQRYRTAPESVRKGELKPVSGVDVIDPHTVRVTLSQPYAPLVAVLADRAGMIMSPKAMARLGAKVADELPCAGPFQLKQRIPQDRIVVERFAGYWNASAIKLDRIIYQPIPNTAVRLVDLKAGQLDMVERLGPADVAGVKADPHLRLVTATALAYDTMSLNIANGPQSQVLGHDPRIRAALEAAIDRNALNQVVMNGLFVPSNQFEAPGSRYWNPDRPVPSRDVAKAKALLKQAGVDRVAFTLLVGNSSVEQQVGQVIQAMAAEAGFDIKLQAMEANALVAATQAGNYQAAVVIWSGRPDPDGNVSIWLACDGFLNWGKYCNPAFDDVLARARETNDIPQRQALYRQLSDIYLNDRPHLVLYHRRWLWAMSDKVSGFTPTADGLIRPQGIEVAP
ncbi:MAG TPA: ABC transporter substrate-binding protein [Acetobacteraceae bacterium]